MTTHINFLDQIPLKHREFEIVERKGVGHPDTICDSLMDSMSVALSKAYRQEFGMILHHNLDKCLLTAGSSEPKFNGGKITSPMKIIMGDRATTAAFNKTINLNDIFVDNGKKWFDKNLRYVDSSLDVKFLSEIHEGSQNLVDIFSRNNSKYLGANDTSATVGYYPFTDTELLVKNLEKDLNSKAFHKLFPMAGEDVKIMAYREKNDVTLTVAMAMVDTYIEGSEHYFKCKSYIVHYIKDEFSFDGDIKIKNVYLNALDARKRGTGGLYLTVSGTSAEAGDSGQVGRGNDVAGIIPLCRPMASEAAPGKNPVSHVGKIYNALCFKIAKRITEGINCDEAYVWLVSRIGKPINEPAMAAVNITGAEDEQNRQLIISEIIAEEFENLDKFCAELSEGKVKLF